MSRILNNDWFLAFLCLLMGSVAGYLVGNQPARIRGLESEIAFYRSERARSGNHPTGLSLHSGTILASRGRSFDVVPTAAEEGWTRRRTEAHEREIEARVEDASAEREVEYTLLFSTLGLSAEESERMKSKLAELHRMAILAGDPLGDLASARSAYDGEMRALLGEEGYIRYRAYEASKPAVREYDKLREYALVQEDQILDPVYTEEIVRLIELAGAATSVTWHEPYDPLPRPVAGDAAVEKMRSDHSALVQSSQLLHELAVSSGIPDEYVQLLDSYYDSKVKQARDTLAFWDRPAEEALNELKAQLELSIEQLKMGAN